MAAEERMIGRVPAFVWGEPSRSVYLAVHGKHGCKEEASGFARLAGAKHYLGGERKKKAVRAWLSDEILSGKRLFM